MRSPALVAAAALALAACGSPSSTPRDAGPVLLCPVPISIALEPSTTPPNTGLPMAGIAWRGDQCWLVTDEHDPDLILLVADLTGTIFGAGLTANSAGDWNIAESSTGAGPTTYIAGFDRDADVRVVLQRADDPALRVVITFRVTTAGTLDVSELHLE